MHEKVGQNTDVAATVFSLFIKFYIEKGPFYEALKQP